MPDWPGALRDMGRAITDLKAEADELRETNRRLAQAVVDGEAESTRLRNVLREIAGLPNGLSHTGRSIAADAIGYHDDEGP